MTQERKRRSDAERADIMERWHQSGQTARQFAEQEGLHASLLYQWRKQLKAATHEEQPTEERRSGFSELRLSTAQAQQSAVEIVTRNGRIVRVHGDISVRALQHVLAAVEQC
jgi:transposase-like protein